MAIPPLGHFEESRSRVGPALLRRFAEQLFCHGMIFFASDKERGGPRNFAAADGGNANSAGGYSMTKRATAQLGPSRVDRNTAGLRRTLS
jgi:hypothetical protein